MNKVNDKKNIEKKILTRNSTSGKKISEIKEIKLGLIHSGISFHVKINYEKRSMRRDLDKFKVYYLFLINVSLVEENHYHNNARHKHRSCHKTAHTDIHSGSPHFAEYSDNWNPP